MFVSWVIFHVIVCIALVLVVLMQSSKGEGLAGSAFSSGVSGAVFGGRGAATFLSKSTTILAVVFFLNCGALAYMSAQRSGVSTGTTATDSAVTRQAQRAVEAEQQRQQQADQQKTDAAQPAAPSTTPIDTTK